MAEAISKSNDLGRHHVWKAVHRAWPDDAPVPTGPEAIKGAKRLYKRAMGRPWNGPVKLTSGRRHTWIRRGVFYVNPDEQRWRGDKNRGWREIVHSVSHYAHMRLNPHLRPHDDKQAYLERDLAEFVVKSGFLDGKLKSKAKPKPKVSVVDQRAMRAKKLLALHRKKLEREKRLVKKWQAKVRYYENKIPVFSL
jgi:hypothetical protein